jgi:hypothetical protein
MTVAWGQNAANGPFPHPFYFRYPIIASALQASSALGPTSPRALPSPHGISHSSELTYSSACPHSLPRPVSHVALRSIVAGQNTTYFLATPSDKLSDLPRHPADFDAPDLCVHCNEDTGDDDAPLECDKVRPLLPLPPSSLAHPRVPGSATARGTSAASRRRWPRYPTASGSAPTVRATRARPSATRTQTRMRTDSARTRMARTTRTRMRTRTATTPRRAPWAGSARRLRGRRQVRHARASPSVALTGAHVRAALHSVEEKEVGAAGVYALCAV